MTRENDFMNVSEAASLLGVHIQTLRKLARQKKIPAFKLGRDWRFRKQALIRWADEQQLESSGENASSVLIIDDEEKVRAALTGMVKRFGCRTRQVADGIAALALVAEETPDVILLDLKMPGMNGPQFLAELRKDHQELPVVIVTGYPNGELMQRASQYPPVMLLAKPVEPEHLERTLRTLVGAKSKLTSRGGTG